MIKRVLSVFLSLVICLGIFPIAAYAKESKAYKRYQKAMQATTASGSWSETLTMTVNMVISDGSAKMKTKAAVTSDMDISNYDEKNLSGIKMSGSASISVMQEMYAWDIVYENGIGHYTYTEPEQTPVDLEMDPNYFNFGTMTEEMMTKAKVFGNKITFTVPGEKMEEAGIAAVNLMQGIDNLDYGDVDVEAIIDKAAGTIDKIVMTFHASLTYQGYDAEVDYHIDYAFSPNASGSADSKNDEHSDGSSNFSDIDARAEWIRQHMEYATSDEYQTEIVGGFSNQMQDVFRNALDDEGIQSYNARKALSALLNNDVEFDDADMYELIIAQILYGQDSRELTEQAFEVNYRKTLGDITKSLVNVVNSGDAAKDLPKDIQKSINELYKLLQTLEYGSDKYGKTLQTLFGQIKTNGKETINKWKTELLGDAAFTGLSVVIDGAFEQYDALEDIAIYISNYVAYKKTSEQTREVLERLAVNVLYKYDSWYGVGELIDELGLWGSIKNWPAFQTALVSVIEAMEASEEDFATAVAKYAVEREKKALDKFAAKTVKEIKIFVIEKGLSCVPVIKTILIAKNMVLATVNITIWFDEIFTDIQDREYALDMLTKTFCISVMLDKTVEDCADSMSKDDFYSTTVFDEAVFIYKRNLLLASGYAIKYADLVLANAEAELEKYDEETDFGNREGILERLLKTREKLVQAVTRYTNSLASLEEQQAKIEAIACHDTALYYNQLTDEIINNFNASKIYIVACPVDVIIKNESGEQIAYLSGEDNEVIDDYKFYFHTIKVSDDSGEYIKVAIVPENYRIEMKGTDNGVMHAFVADFTTEDVGEVETYFNIPVKKNTKGYFEVNKDGSGESTLVMSRKSYSNMTTIEDIPDPSQQDSYRVFIVAGGVIVGFLLLLLLFKVKHSKR